LQTKSKQNDLLLAFGAFGIAFILWQFRPLSLVVYPLRLFVTFIHELGHGVAALATGGEFVRFELQSSGAGLAYSAGGIQPIIIAAGYVGTALFGAALLYAANHITKPQHLAIGLGGAFVLLTLLYSGLGLGNFNILEILLTSAVMLGTGYVLLTTSDDQRRRYAAGGLVLAIGLGLYFGAGDNALSVVVGISSGVLLILLGVYGQRDPTLFILNFLAFAVGLNAISDAWFLLQINSRSDFFLRNDASSMAAVTPLPAVFWALMWMLLAIVLLGGVIWFTFVRRQANEK